MFQNGLMVTMREENVVYSILPQDGSMILDRKTKGIKDKRINCVQSRGIKG